MGIEATDENLERTEPGMVYLVMGVCGVGKTSIGKLIANILPARFIEADDFHSNKNITAMSTNLPLTDEMRVPWLQMIATKAENARQYGDVVTACSALRKSYRDLLRDEIRNVIFIHLTGDIALIAERLDQRREHFMSPKLLESQFKTLEPPQSDESPIVIDVSGTREEILESVISRIRAL
jgi:gluconokinase